jgi:hypothetical protein
MPVRRTFGGLCLVPSLSVREIEGVSNGLILIKRLCNCELEMEERSASGRWTGNVQLAEDD